MVAINLLPWRENLSRDRGHRIILYLALLFLPCVIYIYFFGQKSVAKMDFTIRQNKILQMEEERLTNLLKIKINVLQDGKKKQHLLEKIAYFEKRKIEILLLFSELSFAMPENAYLKNIDISYDKVSINGFAYKKDDVLMLISNIKKSKFIGSPILMSIKNDWDIFKNNDGCDFAIIFKVKKFL